MNIVACDVGVIFSCESADNVPGNESSVGAYRHVARSWCLYFKPTKTPVRIEVVVLRYTHVALKGLIECTKSTPVHKLHD